uniref:Uncharacterized protein n=1 Tax=Rhizophora mucronata TaxID=61149 RepID=A0A2P2K730_RHIMU
MNFFAGEYKFLKLENNIDLSSFSHCFLLLVLGNRGCCTSDAVPYPCNRAS